MAKRTKKTVIASVSREQMEEAFGAYASADAEIAKINADMDKQFTAIREMQADRLAELEKVKEDNFDVLNVFASEHKDELFSKKKSLESTHGIIGFRKGMPKLKTRKGFTWVAVLELLRNRGHTAYIRTTDEIAKDKLLADRESEDTQKIMQNCGIDAVQDETFYVELKKESED